MDLKGAKSERCRRPEDRRKDRQHVYQVAGKAIDPLTEDRVETGTDQRRHAASEREVSDREADDRIDRPWMEPPVEEGVEHGKLRRIRGCRVEERGRPEEMDERFRDAPEEDPDPHPGSKEHRGPPEETVLWPFVIMPEPDRA